MTPTSKTLLLGFGNPDRQDDGIAWHVLRAVAARMGLPAPISDEDDFPQSERVNFLFQLQLTPELAEEISRHERVCFVDAQTGDIPGAVRLVELKCEFQRSPLTHHLTPQSLLAICDALYHVRPRAALLSLRGSAFGFSRDLSPASQELLPEALKLIEAWLGENADGGG